MKKSLKHAIFIFLTSAIVLFVIFSPIFFKKNQSKSPTKNQVSVEDDKKEISNSPAGAIAQVENRLENKSEDKKEPVNLEDNNSNQSDRKAPESQEEIVEVLSSQNNQPSSTPIPSPSSTIIIYSTPLLQRFVTVEIQRLSNYQSYQVELKENDTAFSVLLRAAQENSFTISYQNYGSLGVFVDCIVGVCGSNNSYWAFYYNGEYSAVGASSRRVGDGDITSWKLED